MYINIALKSLFLFVQRKSLQGVAGKFLVFLNPISIKGRNIPYTVGEKRIEQNAILEVKLP